MATKTKKLQKDAQTLQDDTAKLGRDAAQTAKDAGSLVAQSAGQAVDAVTDTAAELKESAERIFMAGLGALSVAEKKGSTLFKKLNKKGEKYGQKVVGKAGLKRLTEGVENGVQSAQDEAAGLADRALDTVRDSAKAAQAVAGQAVGKAEATLQDAVTAALSTVGVPTRSEIMELSRNVERLTKQVSALKKADPAPVVAATSVGGGWYAVSVNGVVVEKVQGKDEAHEAVASLEAGTYSERELGTKSPVTVEANSVGGGWYEITVGGLVVEKVQGKDEATAAAEALMTGNYVDRVRAAQQAPDAAVEAVAQGGGWYEIRVGDLVVEKVQGKEAADAAVERLSA